MLYSGLGNLKIFLLKIFLGEVRWCVYVSVGNQTQIYFYLELLARMARNVLVVTGSV